MTGETDRPGEPHGGVITGIEKALKKYKEQNIHFETTPEKVQPLSIGKDFDVRQNEMSGYRASSSSLVLRKSAEVLPRGAYKVIYKGTGSITYPDENGIYRKGVTEGRYTFTLVRQVRGSGRVYGWLDPY